jgi:AraC-like DNA-binding protein
MSGNSDTVICGEDTSWSSVSTFTYQTSERAEVTIRHVSLDAYQEAALWPSTMDEAFTVILHLSAADLFELHGITGLLWSGRCPPGSVNVVARREALTLKTSHPLEALVLGIPHSSVPRVAPQARANGGERRAEPHDPCDVVGHSLGLAFLAAFKSAADPRSLSTVHLARAMCYHFAFKHTWVQGKSAGAEPCGLAPWQARTAARLLDRGDLQVREVAAACHLSSSVFPRLFRATFLQSPHAWKADRRIDAVKELLRDADVSLSDAALQAGFSDQASMSRSFRRLVGASPGEWRMSQHESQA